MHLKELSTTNGGIPPISSGSRKDIGSMRCSCSWHESKIRPRIMEANYTNFDSFDGISELSEFEKQDIKGGGHVVVAVIGASAAVAYLYEYGYNMVDKALARNDSK